MQRATSKRANREARDRLAVSLVDLVCGRARDCAGLRWCGRQVGATCRHQVDDGPVGEITGLREIGPEAKS